MRIIFLLTSQRKATTSKRSLDFPNDAHICSVIEKSMCEANREFFLTLCWDLGRTNSPTSARRGNNLEYIRIKATPSRKLVF